MSDILNRRIGYHVVVVLRSGITYGSEGKIRLESVQSGSITLRHDRKGSDAIQVPIKSIRQFRSFRERVSA